MSKLKGLGTNFEALVPVGVNVDVVSTAPEQKIYKLAVDVVKPKLNQPRQYFDDQELQKLAHSIKQQGILQPIVVTGSEQNSYTIIAGERRWRAASLAGLNEIPAIIKEVNDLQHLQLAILENVQRQDLSALEVAESIYRLHNEYQQSYEDIANSLGKAYTTVVNLVRLLQLPEVIKGSLANGTITEGHGRALLSLGKSPDLQKKLYQQILGKNLSVRQAEATAAVYKNGVFTANKVNETSNKQGIINEKALASKLGLKKVELKQSKKGGKLILSYTTKDDLARLTKILGQ